MDRGKLIADWLESTARLLIDPGDRLAVSVNSIGARYIIIIETDEPGALIGRKGSTIMALRGLANKIGARMNVSIMVDVDTRGHHP